MGIIQLPHKVLDYACPINGLEDLYEAKMGLRFPGYQLMDLSNVGFTYVKQKRAAAPRMITWGTGVGPAQYRFLAPIMSFDYVSVEGKSFSTAWHVALESLEEGVPLILGALDMYYLPYYPKFYKCMHIPQHYVLLIGYDPIREEALVQDTGLAGVQRIPIDDLRRAWDVRIPGLNRPNSLYQFHFEQEIGNIQLIVRRCLHDRAYLFLQPPVKFQGLLGIRKAQKEILKWGNELTPNQYRESLNFLATFSCSVVPNLPQRLHKSPLGYTDPHQGVRDRLANTLRELANKYQEPTWEKAGNLFAQSGEAIGSLTEAVTNTLLGDSDAILSVPNWFAQIADYEESAFKLLASVPL